MRGFLLIGGVLLCSAGALGQQWVNPGGWAGGSAPIFGPTWADSVDCWASRWFVGDTLSGYQQDSDTAADGPDATKTYVQSQIPFPHNKFECYATDFLYATTTLNPPWSGVAVNSGTVATTAAEGDHPGTISLKSSTTANSGYRWMVDVGAFLISGTEISEFVFQVVTTANTTTRLGFQDNTSYAAPTDGLWLNIAGTDLYGVTMSNRAGDTTNSTYEITASTWYHGKIEVNPDATVVNFSLYDEAGSELWADTSMSYIPIAAGRGTGHGIITTNSGTSAVDLVYIDFMNLYMTRTLVR